MCDGDTCSFVPKAGQASNAGAVKREKNASLAVAPRGGSTALTPEKKGKKRGGSVKGGKAVAKKPKAAPRTFLQRALDYILSFFGVEPPVGTKIGGSKREAGKLSSGGGSAVPPARKGAKALPQTAPLSRAAQRKARGGAAASRSSAALRIQRELRDFQTNAVPHMAVVVSPSNMNVWVVTLTGVEGTLFAGEKYKLRIEFPKEYPTRPPSVYFLKPTPRMVHVYTNGDICLDLLGKGWRPQLTAKTLSISILSMLSSAREKGLPPDNANHADAAPGQIQEGWLYHDDHC